MTSGVSLFDIMGFNLYVKRGDPLPNTFLPGIYAIFDENEECLYIGQSKDIRSRLLEHARSKPWYKLGASIKIRTIADSEFRLVMETILILIYKPRNNRAIKMTKGYEGPWKECQFLRLK